MYTTVFSSALTDIYNDPYPKQNALLNKHEFPDIQMNQPSILSLYPCSALELKIQDAWKTL